MGTLFLHVQPFPLSMCVSNELSVNLPGKELSAPLASLSPVVSFFSLSYCSDHVLKLVCIKDPENTCYSVISLFLYETIG